MCQFLHKKIICIIVFSMSISSFCFTPAIKGIDSLSLHTISFLVDSTIIQCDSLFVGDIVKAPAPPVKDGFTFTGWAGLYDIMPDEDIKVYALFAQECNYLFGDTNRDGLINSSDVVEIYNVINYGAESGKDKKLLDINGDSVISSTDVAILYEVLADKSRFTGLPIMIINTEGNLPIDSKEEYVQAQVSIVSHPSVIDFNNCNLPVASAKIRGRGNSSWGMPKKSYKLKFNKKTSLFGEAKNRDWVLLANYSDKTMLRNAAAFYMGKISNLDWSPCSHFVDLQLNGEYVGTYQLTEQVEIAKHRVNVTDKGYLLEGDARAKAPDDVVFYSTRSSVPYCIKEPDIEPSGEKYNWIKNHILKIENSLYSEDWFSDSSYYAKFVDKESFVDWFLINEIAKNADAHWYSSCYMSVDTLGTLRMGPLWDFDIAFGNINYGNGLFSPKGYYLKSSYLFSKMLQDPEFKTLMLKRFKFFNAHLSQILNFINQQAYNLRYSAKRNDEVWQVIGKYVWPNYVVLGSYEDEVNYLISFIIERMRWLEHNLSSAYNS